MLLDLEYSVIDGRAMYLSLACDGKQISAKLDKGQSIGRTVIELDCRLPCEVVLTFGGKNYQTDTLIDQDGHILQDLYIKIVRWSLDGFDLSQDFFYNRLTWQKDDGTVATTPYLGFNGVLRLPLTKSNVFDQYYALEEWYDYYNLIDSVATNHNSM